MSAEDIFDSVQAPCWAESLQEKNADWEEADDSFFPETPTVEEVVVHQLEQLAVTEDSEDLSRMAMFGKKTQIKRRSQIRREQEQSSQKKPAVPTAPSAIPKRPTSIPRAPSVTRTKSAVTPYPTQPSAITVRVSGPVTRSQTRVVTNTPTVSNPRRSREMSRNSSLARRSVQPSPIPNQQEFNRALNQRAGSLGKDAKSALATPLRSTLATKQIPSSISKPVLMPKQADKTEEDRSQAARPRVPVPVKNSPRPAIAFGAAVRPTVGSFSRPIARSRQEPTDPVRGRSSQVTTPVRPLTLPRTPVVLKRMSSITQPVQPATPTTEKKVLKPRDIQGMVDRLSKPKNTVTRPTPTNVNKRIVPNTYTHGISTSKVRSRSLSRASSRNDAPQDENTLHETQ